MKIYSIYKNQIDIAHITIAFGINLGSSVEKCPDFQSLS